MLLGMRLKKRLNVSLLNRSNMAGRPFVCLEGALRYLSTCEI